MKVFSVHFETHKRLSSIAHRIIMKEWVKCSYYKHIFSYDNSSFTFKEDIKLPNSSVNLS